LQGTKIALLSTGEVNNLDDKDTRAHVEMLQSLQKSINSLNKVKEDNPSIEKTIEILRNSQDQLYGALAQHGVTAEAVHKILIENSDKKIVAEIMRLQRMKDNIRTQLTRPGLSPDQTQKLEQRLAKATQDHVDRWDEAINDPRKDEIISKIQQAQIKEMEREERERDKTRDHDRTRE
jgi:hypothetical protein